MTDHLPECPTVTDPHGVDGVCDCSCLCPELRACEERVLRDMDSVYGQGFQAGRESMLAHFIHRDAEIVRLTRLWHEGVSLDHHKDRDCHWYITVKYSYGDQPTFTASHNGYIGPQWQGEEFTTYAQAAADLKHKLERCIEDRIAWAREQLVDPYGWFDDDARRLLQVLENTSDNTPDITGQSVVKSADLSDPQMGEMIYGDR